MIRVGLFFASHANERISGPHFFATPPEKFRRNKGQPKTFMGTLQTLKLAGLTAFLAALAANVMATPVSFTGLIYSQNFDSMALGTTTPTGWFVGTGTGAAVTGTTVIPDIGASSGGGNYNYGVGGAHTSADRALGSIGDGAAGGQIDTEVDIQNNSPFAITQFTISYTGEEWRNSGSTIPNTLTLQLSTNGLTWTNLGSAFNFVSPVNTGGAGSALDGNAAANRTIGLGGTVNLSTPIGIGSTFYLRFADPNDPKPDTGIAVDDFTFQAVPEPSAYMLLGVGLLLCGQRFLRRGLAQTFGGAGLRRSARLISFSVFLVGLSFASNTQAQWLTHTPDNAQPPGTATNAAFPYGLSGNVTATVTVAIDGLGNGIPGISPNPFTAVTNTFNSFFSVNPGTNTFDFLNITSNDTGDFLQVVFDFSGLQGGVLPAGSTIAFLDVDNNENVLELSGFAQGGLGGQYFTPWLTQFNGVGGTPPDAFDYENPDGGVLPALAAVVNQSSGFYSLVGDPSNEDSAFQGFTTNVPLGSLSFIYDLSDPTGNANPAFNTYGIAIQAVPEPQ